MFRELLIPAAATAAPAALMLLLAYVLRLQWGRQRPNPVPAGQVIDRLWRERQLNPGLYAVPVSPAWTVPTTRKLVAVQ